MKVTYEGKEYEVVEAMAKQEGFALIVHREHRLRDSLGNFLPAEKIKTQDGDVVLVLRPLATRPLQTGGGEKK